MNLEELRSINPNLSSSSLMPSSSFGLCYKPSFEPQYKIMHVNQNQEFFWDGVNINDDSTALASGLYNNYLSDESSVPV